MVTIFYMCELLVIDWFRFFYFCSFKTLNRLSTPIISCSYFTVDLEWSIYLEKFKFLLWYTVSLIFQVIGGADKYMAVCRKCYFAPVKVWGVDLSFLIYAMFRIRMLIRIDPHWFGRIDPDPRREPKDFLCLHPVCRKPCFYQCSGSDVRIRIRRFVPLEYGPAPDSVPSLFSVAFKFFRLLLTGTYFGYIYTSL